MSSCAASCCTYCPKASSAFATLASSPTADAPLSCRFAFKYSTQPNHRTPGQKLPLPRNRARCGSVPNVAAPWWLSRDLPLPNSNSVLHLFSQESPHENYNFNSLTRCASPPIAVVCSSCHPMTCHFQPRLKVSPRPRQTPTKPTLPALLLTPLPVPRSLNGTPNIH
jgi:hypothetical protein